MSAIWPTAVATDANLSVAVNSLQTTLGSGIGSSDVTIALASTTGFPTAGYVTIDNEVISYTGVSGGNLTGCGRGADGTSAATHTTGAAVSATIVAAHHNSLKDEIKAIETTLSGLTGLSPTLPLTASKVMVTDGSGHVAVSAVTPTTLAFLDATSSVQTQINAVVATANAALPTAGGTMSGAIAMGSHKITGLTNGSSAQDAAAFGQIPAAVAAAVIASGTSTTTLGAGAGTMTATVVTGSITPLSASHRVKITASFHVATASNIGLFSVFRNTSNLQDATGGGQAGSATINMDSTVCLTWIDSPATTSAVAYTIYGENGSGSGNVLVGNGRTWTIVLEEII